MKGTKPEIIEEPGALGDLPSPEWFSDYAGAEWGRVMPILTDRRILTDADLGNLENYCVAIGMVLEFEKQFQVTGDIDVRLKLFRAMDKAMGTARQLGAELGLTPVSRSRPSVRETEDGDDAPNPLDQ